MFGAARPIDEATDLVLFVVSEAPNPAVISISLPQGRVYVPLDVEGSDEVVTVPRRPEGIIFGASEIEQDATEVNQFGRRFRGVLRHVETLRIVKPSQNGSDQTRDDDCQPDAS